MKTLGEIRRNIISFYSTIQDKVTDFSVGSVVSGLIYSFSSALEGAYAELEEIRNQAYIATATGTYLDRLIEGTFQLSRSQDTRAVGYVVVYAEAPLNNFANVELKYADFDYSTGEFIGGMQGSTKFVGFNVQGDEGIVFSLIRPRNNSVLETDTRLIRLSKAAQFLILPVASVNKGSISNIREGGIYSFPSPPPGLTGVLNTSNPGAVFFSSQQAVSGSPFYSRFTEALDYNNALSSFTVLNAYNFSTTGFIELKSNTSRTKSILATYSEFPNGGGVTDMAGLVFEYIDASSNTIILKNPIENAASIVPTLRVRSGSSTKVLTLDSFTYDGVTYTNEYDGQFDTVLFNFIDQFADRLLIEQRALQVNPDLIFDPDNVLTSDYRIPDAAMVSGASDQDSDEEYREALIKYLGGLSRATGTALEAGALQVSGVSFAKTLPKHLSPRGTVLLLASGDDGYLTPAMKSELKTRLNEDWKAAGVEILIKSPETIAVNTTVTVKLQEGIFSNSVSQQIRITLDEYLKSRNPGDSLRYSDVMNLISDIGGVMNVFNLLLTRQLSDETYREYKAKYDEAVIVRASESGIIRLSSTAHGLSGGELIHYNDTLNTYSVVGSLGEANGIVYAPDGPNAIEILTGNATLLNSLYTNLVSNPAADTVDYFTAQIVSHSAMFDNSDDMMFFMSYVVAEPLGVLPDELYPVDIDNINYKYITDYTASDVEIFRQNNIVLDNTVEPFIGIRYI